MIIETYVVLLLRDLRALVCVICERIPELDGPGPLREPFQKLVVDPRLDEDARSGATCLAMVPAASKVEVGLLKSCCEDQNFSQDTMCAPSHRQIQIRIVEDDIRTLASELQAHILQITFCCALHNLPSDRRRACKGDLLDFHMRCHGMTDDVSCSGDDIDDAGRKAGFVDKGSHAQSGERREFGRFENDSVAASQRRADLPAHQQD